MVDVLPRWRESGRTTILSCPSGKICLETSLKLWMSPKNSEMPLMSTQALPRQIRNSFWRNFFLGDFSSRLFTFLGLSCLHRLLTNFPFLPRRIKGTFSHLESFSNFAFQWIRVIPNGFLTLLLDDLWDTNTKNLLKQMQLQNDTQIAKFFLANIIIIIVAIELQCKSWRN